MSDPVLLTDEQMQRFIAHGFLRLQTQLSDAANRKIFDRFDAFVGGETSRNPGNNLLPAVPEMNEVFADPVMRGALISTVGPDHAMHPHRALHNNKPGSEAQAMHKDSYWGYTRRVRNHRSRWVMIMYVPQDTPVDRGPTGVVPGTQYLMRRPLETVAPEAAGALAAGGFLLIHYDIWHRKMKNHTTGKRFMAKFEFIRMQAPRAASWDHRDPDWRLNDLPGTDLSPLWSRQWDWLRAAPSKLIPLDPALAQALRDPEEPARLNAAYRLASAGGAAIGILAEAFREGDGQDLETDHVGHDEAVADTSALTRASAYGLAEIGAAAAPALLDLLAGSAPRGRKYAAYALGEIASPDRAIDAALCHATRDDEAAVRINAVEALGLRPATASNVAALGNAIRDSDPHVRFSAALSLAQLGPAADPAVPALGEALLDRNRYVPGYAVEALERIATPRALQTLIPFLKSARWCPHTNETSIF
ncbi:HEAT repeat domain-containing protein [Lichenicoccus sp.]|uniref:HEAT repeat domain-containing protein n=1 Tax=Lichenicoccus sp. TaxID=2781899 RepID=UPI003D127A38